MNDYKAKNQHNKRFRNGKENVLFENSFTALPLSLLQFLDVNIKLKYWVQPKIVVLNFHCNCYFAFNGCVHYIFPSLFFNFKREHLQN